MAPDLLIGLAGVFVAVGVIAGTTTSALLRRHAPARRRLRQLAQPGPRSVAGPLELTDEPSALAARICRFLPRSAERMGEMRRRLVSAGYRSQGGPVVYAASQI